MLLSMKIRTEPDRRMPRFLLKGRDSSCHGLPVASKLSGKPSPLVHRVVFCVIVILGCLHETTGLKRFRVVVYNRLRYQRYRLRVSKSTRQAVEKMELLFSCESRF